MDYARLTWGPSVGRLMMATATVVALTAGLATPTLAGYAQARRNAQGVTAVDVG